MEYRVEEIARAAGLSVDTVRFYQSRRLLPAPERRGRKAIYGPAHLDRLRQIRALNAQGLTLEGVRRVLEEGETQGDDVKRTLLVAVAEAEGERTLTRAELAREAEIPEFLLESAEQAGLLQPLTIDGEPRYTEGDLGAVRAGTQLLQSGLPLQELLPLAREHADNMASIADGAVELFDRYIRHRDDGADATPSSDDIKQAFRDLLPAVTALVALHFQRTLLHRARARLEESGEAEALQAALDAERETRLKVSWR